MLINNYQDGPRQNQISFLNKTSPSSQKKMNSKIQNKKKNSISLSKSNNPKRINKLKLTRLPNNSKNKNITQSDLLE